MSIYSISIVNVFSFLSTTKSIKIVRNLCARRQMEPKKTNLMREDKTCAGGV